MEMTLEQKRAVAMAKARQAQEAERAVISDGQVIGAQLPSGPNGGLRIAVEGSPEQSGNMLGNIAGNLGRGAQSSFAGATQGATLGAYDELASALGAPIKESRISCRAAILLMASVTFSPS
jgi:hypothetical protein